MLESGLDPGPEPISQFSPWPIPQPLTYSFIKVGPHDV